MPRQAKQLTALGVKKSKPGYLAAGGTSGLYLQTSKTGTKSWVFRFKRKGKAREMGLGSLSKVSLAVARERARDAWLKLDQGIDPIEERDAAKALMAKPPKKKHTFAQCVEGYFENARSGWKGWKPGEPPGRMERAWRQQMIDYAYPAMSVIDPGKDEDGNWLPGPGDLPVTDITKQHVEAAVTPIWTVKVPTARNVRRLIEASLEFAMKKEWRPEGRNPAQLDRLVLPELTKAAAKSKPRPALPYKQMNACGPSRARLHGALSSWS